VKAIRGMILNFTKFLSQENYEAALGLVQSDLTIPELASLVDEFHDSHGLIRLDPEARNMKHTHIQEVPDKCLWRISQTLIDQENLNDHTVIFQLDLKASDENNAPVLSFESIMPIE
jgi:hypothetical protein